MSERPAFTFTNREKQREAEREVAMRERVHGPNPSNSKTRQLELMRAIAADYRALADKDEKATRLL